MSTRFTYVVQTLVLYLFLMSFSLKTFAIEPVSFIDLTVRQTNYGSAPQVTVQETNYSEVSPSFLIFKRMGSPENSHALVKASGYLVLPMSDGVDFSAALPEAYLDLYYEPRKSLFSFGRKLHTWSELDSLWKLGLWQPLVRTDAANPVEQGLIGAFYELKNKNFKAALMASPLFLPDQQPDYDEESGQIVSANRWFRPPVSRLEIENNTSRVNYEVSEPDFSNIIDNTTVAGLLRIGQDAGGVFLLASASDKPMNQFHLTIDPAKGLGILDSTINVTIYPVVVRHQLYTFETGYKWSDGQVVLSTTTENIEDPRLPEEWEQTELIDSRYSGAIYSQDLSHWGLNRSSLGLSYVVREKRTEGDSSTAIEGDIDASTSRFNFEKLVGAQFKFNLIRKYKRELDTSFKYVYSIEDQGEWIQAGLQLREDRNWIWSLALDVFGVPENTPTKSSFISMFRGNDRISGSLTYVF